MFCKKTYLHTSYGPTDFVYYSVTVVLDVEFFIHRADPDFISPMARRLEVMPSPLHSHGIMFFIMHIIVSKCVVHITCSVPDHGTRREKSSCLAAAFPHDTLES